MPRPQPPRHQLARHHRPFTFETMEPRRLMAITGPILTLTNLDVVPGNERMIFNRIQHPNATIPNAVHDKATLRLHNAGDMVLNLTSWTISGPWKIVGTKPSTLAAGGSVNITIQFTATTPPAFTYNETNGTTNTKKAGAYVGSLTIASNDKTHSKQVEQLAGWFQTDSENNEEPSLQSIVNLIYNYKTNINSTHTSILSESSGKKLYGEETNSAYWAAANSSQAVFVRQLASFHTQGNASVLKWFKKGSTTTTTVFTAAANGGQTFLPTLSGSTSPASKSFSTGTSTFGFKIDNEYSDDKKNLQTGGGHHVRFYPVRDHNGNIIANTYFMVMDYSVAGAAAASENYDFNDEVYVISNIKPMGN